SGFSDEKKIRKAWEYGCKTNWKSPNTTDVKFCRNPQGVGIYISKYMAKSNSTTKDTEAKTKSLESLNGRLWYQSQSLSRLRSVVVKENSRFFQLFKTILNSAKSFKVECEYCVKLYF